MNILYLAHRIPYPPNKGDKIRSFFQLRALSKQHAVHLACFVDDKEDLRHVETLRKYCASVDALYRGRATGMWLGLLSILGTRPLSVAAFRSNALADRIARIVNSRRIDLIFVFSSAMAEYVTSLKGIPKVVDFVDVDSAKWRLYAERHRFPMSQLFRLEADRLAKYERELVESFDHSLVVSGAEADDLRDAETAGVISVIPNGVDLDYFANGKGPSAGNGGVVFTGAMDYFPNVDAVHYFCERIFPLIREVVPQTLFHIVGRNPTRRVRALGRQRNVIVTGSVADVRPYLAQARVGVVPLRIARGIQNKVLESMAMGLPVVGTSQAFGGLHATSSDGIRKEDSPERFARAVIEFLQNDELRRVCSDQAMRYVRRSHRWEDCGAQLEALVRRVGHRNRQGSE
jgi:sugar transferase (PEP-CTERM/EpsH1 system associated)